MEVMGELQAAAYQNESDKLRPWLQGLNVDFAKVSCCLLYRLDLQNSPSELI